MTRDPNTELVTGIIDPLSRQFQLRLRLQWQYGGLAGVTDANNNPTTYTYDKRDRVTARKDALNASESYGYDTNGNLTSYTDRGGSVTKYTYDALNRRTFAGFGNTGSTYQSTITYTYDAVNRLTQAVDSIAGTITRGYDGLNRLTQEQSPQGTVNYNYDNANRRTTMAVPGQSQISYGWDNTNRLTGITQGSAAVGFSYDNVNRRTCLTLPNSVVATYGYDHDSRLTSITYGTGGSCANPPSNLGSLSYRYDGDGRRTAASGSLASVTLPANVAGGASTTYNADNEQTMFNGTIHTYDANGNLLNEGTNTYAWDARRHLTSIVGTASAVFVYDGLGRRMSKTVNGTLTQFLYDGLNPVQEQSVLNMVTANLLTGLRVDEYFTRTDSSNNVSALLSDALGSTVGLVGSGGTIATSYTYQPFGATALSGASNANSYQFTGRENDSSGLYYYRARYYSPAFSRFIAQDPSDLSRSSPNLYAYAFDDPVIRGDPSGEGPLLALAVAIGCWGSDAYSLLSGLWQLSAAESQIFIQENQLNQQIDNLWGQQSSCLQSNIDQIDQLQQQYNQLQQQSWNLAYQWAAANFAMSFTGLVYDASCALAVAVADFAPTP